MNIVTIMLRNKMKDWFVLDYMLVYIKKQIAKKFGLDSLVDDFHDLKEQKSKF